MSTQKYSLVCKIEIHEVNQSKKIKKKFSVIKTSKFETVLFLHPRNLLYPAGLFSLNMK